MELLFAGHGLAVSGGWVEGPLLDGGDNGFVDAVAKAAGHFDVGDFAGGVDYDIEDDVALGAAGKSGEIRLGRGEVAGEGNVDVAGSKRVGAGRGVGVGRGWGIGVGGRGSCFWLLGWWRWNGCIGLDLLR